MFDIVGGMTGTAKVGGARRELVAGVDAVGASAGAGVIGATGVTEGGNRLLKGELDAALSGVIRDAGAEE